MKYWDNGFYLEQNENCSRKEISDERWNELLSGQGNGKEIYTNADGYPALRDYLPTEEDKKVMRIMSIKDKLSELSKDMIQDIAGENVENIATKKLEFITLHNELRTLLNKPIRNIKY